MNTNEPLEVALERVTTKEQLDERLNKVYELIDQLGLTYDQVHSGLENDKMDVYYGDTISYGYVISELIYHLKQEDLTETQMNMLNQLNEMNEQGHSLPREILDYLILEEEIDIDGRRMMLDSEWYVENFECDPESVISIITGMMRDKKISDIGI